MRLPALPAILLLLAATPPLAHAQDRVVLVRDGVARHGVAASAAGAAGGAEALGTAAVSCDAFALAEHGELLPSGGTLAPSAFADPATVADGGTIAFVSRIDGDPQSQGLFRADSAGLDTLVLGCGGDGGTGVTGGGCGDPTPVGGTFAGLFHGTFFAPSVNAAGDVLFLADVDGGTSPRGLFLYREATGSVETVAAVGHVVLGSVTVEAVGPGSLDDSGRVAFLARVPGGAVAILEWDAGATSIVVRPGLPAPGGGTFGLIASEQLGFSDGTTMPVGPVPGIDDAGRVSFRGQVIGGPGGFGLFVADDSGFTPYVRTGDPTPAGGTFTQFQGAPIADSGEIAFFADFSVGGDNTSGWFAGSPSTGFRAAMVFDDVVDGGTVVSMAFSRNPMTPLDAYGNLVLWARLELPGGALQDRLLVSTPAGELLTVAAAGDAAPSGGTLSNFQSWPSVDDSGLVTVSASLQSAGSVLSAHNLAQLCPPSVAAVTPGAGLVDGGVAVTVDGSGFATFGDGGQLALAFDGVPATGVAVVDDAQLLAVTPAGAPGPADVTVSHPFGSSTLAGGYLVTPAIASDPPTLQPGDALTIENTGPPGALFETWLSPTSTSVPLPPLGTLLIGPAPVAKLLPTSVYPAGGTATDVVLVPADPSFSGVTAFLQSAAVVSLSPLEVRLSDSTSVGVL